MPESISRLDAANKAKEPFLLAPKAERVRLEWCHHHLWAAVLGEEFSNTPDRDWDATVKQLYKGVPYRLPSVYASLSDSRGTGHCMTRVPSTMKVSQGSSPVVTEAERRALSS